MNHRPALFLPPAFHVPSALPQKAATRFPEAAPPTPPSDAIPTCATNVTPGLILTRAILNFEVKQI